MSLTNTKMVQTSLFTITTITTTGGVTTTLIRFIHLPTGGTIQATPITGDSILILGDGHPGTMVTTPLGIDPTIMDFTLTTIPTGTTMVLTGQITVITMMVPITVTARLQEKPGRRVTARVAVMVTP